MQFQASVPLPSLPSHICSIKASLQEQCDEQYLDLRNAHKRGPRYQRNRMAIDRDELEEGKERGKERASEVPIFSARQSDRPTRRRRPRSRQPSVPSRANPSDRRQRRWPVAAPHSLARPSARSPTRRQTDGLARSPVQSLSLGGPSGRATDANFGQTAGPRSEDARVRSPSALAAALRGAASISWRTPGHRQKCRSLTAHDDSLRTRQRRPSY